MRRKSGSWFPLVSFLLIAACSAPQTQDKEHQQKVSTRSSDTVEDESSVGTGPISRRVRPGPLPPAIQPDGIISIAVPSLVTEPEARYDISDEARRGDFKASDTPTIAGPGDKGMGRPVVKGEGQPTRQSTSEVVPMRSDPPSEPLGPLAPTLDSSFDTADFDDNASTTGYIFIPPDPIGTAGPAHLVNVVNVLIEFYQKDGTRDFSDSLRNFFTTLSPLTFTFDPKVIYDQYAERFVVTTLERTTSPTNTSRIFIAVSDDPDPNGVWFFAEIPSALDIGGNLYWADYPGFAIDEEAVYITANMFSFAGNAWGGVRLWSIDKGQGVGGLYDGGSLSATLTNPYGGGGIATTTQPAHIFGSAPTGVGTFLVSYSGISNGFSESVQVVRVDNPLTAPFFTQRLINVGNIESTAAALPDAPQSGTTDRIETNDRRALNAVWRDDSLWTTATIRGFDASPGTYETFATWWQIDTTNLAIPALTDQGVIDGEDIGAGTFAFFPSIAVTSAGDVGIGFSASGSTIFPGSYYTTRSAGDPAGSNSGAEVLRAGTDSYFRDFNAGRNRWGDYTGTAVDPVDECFWIYNEHAITRAGSNNGGTGKWGTAFGRACACDQSFALTQGQWKQIALACDTGGVDTVETIFGEDLGAGNYGTTWGMYAWNAASNAYSFLALTDPLSAGTGYWIGTQSTSQVVDVQGVGNSVIEVPLTSDPTGRFNQVGHPFHHDVCWADAEVIDSDDTVLTLAEADPGNACQSVPAGVDCVMSRIAYKWSGASYASFDGTTSGAEGTLVPLDGFWVKAYEPGIKLRIPATTGSCGPPATRPPSSEIRGTQSLAGSSLSNPTARRISHIRLMAASGQMHDDSAVMGRTRGSQQGYDPHDLPKLRPFGSDHLTVVFPHPDWGVRAGDYATDFRPSSREEKQEVWSFEVRTSAMGEEVTLTWDGPKHLLKTATLFDQVTRRAVRVRPGGHYTYVASSGSRSFLWLQKNP